MTRTTRWGGLFAITLAPLAFFYSDLCGRIDATSRTGTHVAPFTSRKVKLDEPPSMPSPGPESTRRLTVAARRIEPPMMYVGHPKGDSGTAFVISRTHRLLATNAHVAKIMEEAGGMIAIQNGSRQWYPVEKVWYHPDYVRSLDEGVCVLSGGRWEQYRGLLAPDLAVMRLADEGPDLQAECVLARPGETVNLASMSVGLLGFSGPWPTPGHAMEAVFKSGTVSLLTAFAPLGHADPRWQMVDFTAICDEGDSGGPIFSEDGHVIAIFAWCRSLGDRQRGRESSAGIRVDALWELLDNYGLTSLVAKGF